VEHGLVFGLVFTHAQAKFGRPLRGLRVKRRADLNIGLALMVVLNLFPGGVLQLLDVLRNGYAHARSLGFLNQPLMRRIEWLRLPADAIFIGLGVVPLVLAAVRTYRLARARGVEEVASVRPEPTGFGVAG
jgi:nitric oxide reductase subunit B